MHSRKQIKNSIMWVLVAIILLILLIAAITFSNKREEKFAAAIKEYELCIKDQYETTPTEYYNKFGEYPKCIE